MLLKFIFLLFIVNSLYATQCSPYFNPERFYDAPEYLEKLLKNIIIDKQKIKFIIKKDELYQYDQMEIAQEINENFGGFWNDWIEDGYEMQLTPEDTLFKYNNNYFSLNIFIYGVSGDATKLKATTIKYQFYNYTKEVNKYITCKSNI